jgi:hypothetical protein
MLLGAEMSFSIRIDVLNEVSFYNGLVFLSGYDKSTTNFIMISFEFYALFLSGAAAHPL